ncbi:MAG: F-actin-capping protein subunit beta [Chaenotheca gracillima]|nr:MAG: F-actin-capping protein subunit beta [Chaenotheca gracillima]
MAPHSGFETESFRNQARKDILGLLEGVRGKKSLVLERNLAGPLGLIVNFQTLQDYGVDKFFFLENANVDSSQKNVVFLARGEKAKQAQAIAEQIKRLQQNRQADHEFSIFWVPRRTLVCDKILEDEAVLGDVNVAEFPLFFITLEKDLLSLELEDSFSDLYLRKDPTPTFLAARALMLVQRRHGLFPRIIGKGDNARKLADLLLRMRPEMDASQDVTFNGTSMLGLTPSSTVEELIIIDREVDFATALLTQLTYEGLVDETFEIKGNQAEIDTSIVGAASSQQPDQGSTSKSPAPTQSSQQARKRKIQLDSSDKLYSQLRDANFAIVGGLLNKVARRLESDYESRHGPKSTSELREFVNKLPGYQAEQRSLKIHTGLAEEIMKQTRSDLFSRILEVQQSLAAGSDPSVQHETIEELIAREVPIKTILRLLCLESCIFGGIKPRDFENVKRSILHAYGFQHLLTLDALEKLQLLQSRVSTGASSYIPGTGSTGTPASPQKTHYPSVRKLLHLIVDEVNEQDPNDIAYVYSGYAPLSVRLVQCLLQKQYLLSITKGSGGVIGGLGGQGTTSGGGAAAAIANTQGWRGFEDVVKSVKGKTFDEVQRGEDKAVRARMILNGQSSEKKTTLVFFLGGITFTEIAALRFIARQEKGRRNIVICTTSIISGNKMMDAALETKTFGQDVRES